MSITVAQLVEWIVANRRGKAFNYDVPLIQREVCQAIADGVFAYHEVEGQIQGVVCGRVNEREHTVHIYDVLTTNKAVMHKFMERFLLIYPSYRIAGRRHGKEHMIDNPNKIKEKFYGR